jgi:hypothetical protein
VLSTLPVIALGLTLTFLRNSRWRLRLGSEFFNKAATLPTLQWQLLLA